MLFNSFSFIALFILVVIIYYLIPHKYRWLLLLVASYYFYAAWNPILLLLILFVIYCNYIISEKIFVCKTNTNKKRLLILSIIINFGILIIFKYAMFINHSFMNLFNLLNLNYPIPDFKIILPMGISFYTFQAAAYTIDVYRGDSQPTHNFFKFSLFIMFFPQLVAGPIERTNSLMPQLFSEKKFDMQNIVTGVKIMLVGFFKKVVIADRIAVIVNTVYNSPKDYSGLAFVIASILFSFQVYCDFSGYSDMAIGIARIMGINLMENFKAPFFSKNLRELRRRWHISLTTWFRDYIYIPLGGNKVSKGRTYLNSMIVFLISGFWHGANWTFVIWGVLNGVFVMLEGFILKPINKALKFLKIDDFFITNFFRIVITFLFSTFTRIFFRANTVSDAFYIVKNLFSDISNWFNPQYIFNIITDISTPLNILIAIGILLFLTIMEGFSQEENIHKVLNKKPLILRGSFYFMLTILIFTLGVFYNAGAFIYFQF